MSTFKKVFSIVLIFFACFLGYMVQVLGLQKTVTAYGKENCLHTVPNVDGPEDFAKLGEILMISSNNYLESVFAHTREMRENAKDG